MPLAIIRLDKNIARIALLAAALGCIVLAWFFVRWNFANAIAARLDMRRPESRLVAEWLIDVAPNDPRARFAAATLFEKSFDAADLERSLIEHEKAAALSPHDYRLWLSLGRARSLNGDVSGAEAAYRRAGEIAPNYAAVQWGYGNFLVRQGRSNEGFDLIRQAAESNAEYARTAAVTAMQLTDNDIGASRRLIGDSAASSAALIPILVSQKRFADAASTWTSIDPALRHDKYRPLAETLLSKLAEAKEFRLALGIYNDLSAEEQRAAGGAVWNGGFEGGIKMRGSRLFEWNIADGASPQIGLSEAQKRSGNYSLSLSFDSFEANAFRPVSQIVPVEPGVTYEFTGFYRFDMKSDAVYKWDVVDPLGTVLASTPPLELAGDWATMRASFTVPETIDGVTIRFTRSGCTGAVCPATGRILFDDISISRK